jgi:hypothetical protein
MNSLNLNNWNDKSVLGVVGSERLAIVSPDHLEQGRLIVETYPISRQAAFKMFPAASLGELLRQFPTTTRIDIRSQLLRQDVMALLELKGKLQELRVMSEPDAEQHPHCISGRRRMGYPLLALRGCGVHAA